MPDRDGQIIVRTGGGIFYDINTLPFVAQTVGGNPPYFNQVTVRNPAFPNPALPASTELSLGVPAYDWKTPRLVHYNVAVERALPVERDAHGGVCRVSRQQSGAVGGPECPDSGCTARWHASVRSRKTAPQSRVRSDLAAITGWTLLLRRSVREARIDAFTDRLQFQANYALGRAIDDTQGTVPTESDGSVTQWMDPDRPATDRGPADFDRRHNLTANFIWQTPESDPGPCCVSQGVRRLDGQRHSCAQIRKPIHGRHRGRLLAHAGACVGAPAESATRNRAGRRHPGRRRPLFRSRGVRAPGARHLRQRARATVSPGRGWRRSTWRLRKGSRQSSSRGGRLEFRLDVFNALNRVNLGMPQRIVFAGVRQDEAADQQRRTHHLDDHRAARGPVQYQGFMVRVAIGSGSCGSQPERSCC